MNTLLNNDFELSSKLWVFQSDNLLTCSEEILVAFREFSENWTSHGRKVECVFDVLEGCFLVVLVNEASFRVSGCGIDDMTRCVSEIERKQDINLRDRQGFYVLTDPGVLYIKYDEYSKLADKGMLGDDRKYFNSSISTKGEFEKSWKGTIASSWMKMRFA